MTLPEPISENPRNLPNFADPLLDPADVVQRAFANGWIDVNELDRRLAVIAQADSPAVARSSVADLVELHQRVEASLAPKQAADKKKKLAQVGMSVPFYVMSLATAVCVLIWGLVAITSAPTVFWPIWLTIPLVITYALHFAGDRLFGDEEDKN